MIDARADSTNGTNNTNRKELATLMAVCVPANVGLSGAVLMTRGNVRWKQTVRGYSLLWVNEQTPNGYNTNNIGYILV
jgi:hypothetical protein